MCNICLLQNVAIYTNILFLVKRMMKDTNNKIRANAIIQYFKQWCLVYISKYFKQLYLKEFVLNII